MDVEIIIKCYALSPSMYWNISIFNKIDVFSVGGSVGFIVLKWMGIFQEEAQSAWSDIFLLGKFFFAYFGRYYFLLLNDL